MAKLMAKGNCKKRFFVNKKKNFKLLFLFKNCRLRKLLMTFGEKFTMEEWNDASDHFYVDDKGMIDTESLINMITGKDNEEAEE